MEVGLCVSYVQTEPQVSIMVHPAVMAARASSGGAFATTTVTAVGSTENALWTKTKGTSVVTADYESVSRLE